MKTDNGGHSVDCGSGASGGTAVVIPCFNEEGRVGDVVRAVQRDMGSVRIVVVDDASGDGSADEARGAGATVLVHGCNQGYGAALETGYLFALRSGCSVVLQMDADGQHIAGELPKLLGALGDGHADLVVGSRYGNRAGATATSPVRRLGHGVFSRLLRLLTGLRVSDPTSGFKGLNRRALELFASGVFPCDYPDSDVLLMSWLAGLRVAEVPVTMAPRVGGVSMHSGLRPVYYCAKVLLSMFIVALNIRVWRSWRRAMAARGAGAQ